MKLVCLDLEGVLVPEIWIAFAEASGIGALKRTTRDEPDYDALMRFRLDILDRHGLTIFDIQRIIERMEPMEGAPEFCGALREKTQLIILSDTFVEFAAPLMRKLNHPTLFCNTLAVSPSGKIEGWKLRQQNGKKHAVEAFAGCNIDVFAAGDSYNDLAMIESARAGCLFRAPQAIRDAHPRIPCVDSYNALQYEIDRFLQS